MDELEFDKPVFKQLAPNDTGQAAGHQGGMVIPKDLDPYFPQLQGKTSAANPTIDENIRAILVVGGQEVATVNTRYQFQTWGGARSPERRITGNLGPLRDKAAGDDILMIERSLEDRSLYRLTLLKRGSQKHKAVLAASSGKRWGVVNPLDPPVSESELDEAEAEQETHEKKPLDLFDNEAASVETRSKRIARGRAFQKLTSKYYDNKCALCGAGFVTAKGCEVEAAHIVPRSKKGADDARNGIALCRSHHWAFDKGMWGVGADGKIVVATIHGGKGSNDLLKPFAGKVPAPPKHASMTPDPKAWAWHLTHMFGK
ncbi:HNH endonuclease [Bradyrhizobium sp. GCM10028915]|uniref:HNH endonuclease n=1 Tax=Bradyrhizobium sp. GCM10028915 TaxID=3273385 RepID=UPI00360E77E6